MLFTYDKRLFSSEPTRPFERTASYSMVIYANLYYKLLFVHMWAMVLYGQF